MCGIFGIANYKNASNVTYYGLRALQHRGQESSGIASTDGNKIYRHRDMGLVHECFDNKILNTLKGNFAIGHVRYSTSGETLLSNAQPFVFNSKIGQIAIAHNGNLTNYRELRKKLENNGSIFQTDSDTEVFAHLISLSKEELIEDKIIDALSHVEGAYALLIMLKDKLIAIRDPLGIRPLCVGKLGNGCYVFSSESVSFDIIDAELYGYIEPGEMCVVKPGISLTHCRMKENRKFCIFEYVYFSRPDSYIDNQSVYKIRKGCGERLFTEHPVDVTYDTVVVPVLDSGLSAAVGLANFANVHFELGLFRSHYMGRTFIEPKQDIRDLNVRLKFGANVEAVKDKDVIVVDDSIVRGTTSKKLVNILRNCGARSIHMRISCPPTISPCYYGIDTPTKDELIAANMSIDQVCKYIGADTLGYLSLDGLIKSVTGKHYKRDKDNYCHACFSGDYLSFKNFKEN